MPRSLVVGSLAGLCTMWVASGLRGQDPPKTYFEFQVSKPVRQASGSKAPRYPPELKAAGVQGQVLVQFIVDTLGVADTTTFKVLRSVHGSFSDAVRAALPEMRFVPAELNGRKVRQLVQQPFVFAIAEKGDAPSAVSEVPGEITQIDLSQPGGTSRTPAPTAGTVDGWMLTQRMTVDSGTGQPPRIMTMKAYGTAGRYRMELAAEGMAVLDGMVTLFDSTRSRTSIVITGRKSVSVSPMLRGASTAVHAEEIDRPKTTTDLGSGGRIAGVATRHYRVGGRSARRVTVGERTCVIERPVDAEYWTSSDPVAVEVLRRSRDMARLIAGSSPAASTPDAAPVGGPPGAQLRTLTRTATMTKNGVAAAITTSSEVTAFMKGRLDASLFEPPEGYRVIDMTGFISSARADSILQGSVARLLARMVDSVSLYPGQTANCTSSRAP